MMKPLIQVRDMTVGHGDRILCSGVSFDICRGDCIMLCGANGSGKTTLMKNIAAAWQDRGCVMIPTGIPKVKGFTLTEFVRISCYRQSDMGGRLAPEQEAGMKRALELLGLTPLADRDISVLSDGEFQKACIASALIRNADVMLLDEPTAFLDAENRISVLRTLKALSQGTDGIRPAVVFSTHDLHDGLAVASKVFAIGADRQFRVSEDSLSETVETIFSKKD